MREKSLEDTPATGCERRIRAMLPMKNWMRLTGCQELGLVQRIHSYKRIYKILFFYRIKAIPTIGKSGNMGHQATVYIVDDDEITRDILEFLLKEENFSVAAYGCAETFLDDCSTDMPGCLILDMELPGMDGATLQSELTKRDISMPIIFLSGHGTIPATVTAIKSGAIDFLTKPVDGSQLIARVKDALLQRSQQEEKSQSQQDIRTRIDKLTDREKEIFNFIRKGKTSKEIAQLLCISQRTVELHRAHILKKTDARNLADLINMSMVANIQSNPD